MLGRTISQHTKLITQGEVFTLIFKDIIIFGKSPIKWRQRPNMTLAVEQDVKHQFKQIFELPHEKPTV